MITYIIYAAGILIGIFIAILLLRTNNANSSTSDSNWSPRNLWLIEKNEDSIIHEVLDSFWDIPWNLNKKSFLEALDSRNVSIVKDFYADNLNIILAEGIFTGVPVSFTFCLHDEKFVQADISYKYYYEAIAENIDIFRSKYMELADILSKKYGKPTTCICSVPDENKILQAIDSGYASIFMEWYFLNSAAISLKIVPIEYGVSVYLVYSIIDINKLKTERREKIYKDL